MLKHITALFDQATPLDKTIRISFVITIIFHLFAAYFSQGHHKLDEYGGIFAYTGYGLGLWGEEFLNPGEFPARIRPWIQPLLYMIPISPYTLLGGENPFVLNFLMRAISSALALISFWLFFQRINFFSKEKNQQRLMIMGLCYFWFFPYFHARATAENFGVSFFLIALALILGRRLFLFAGFLLAISFFARFQMVVMIGSLILWLLCFQKEGVIKIIMGGLLGSAVMVVLDSIMYGQFTFTPWQYWEFNIVNGVASSIGVSPWYYYFEKVFLKSIPPLSIVIYLSTLWYWYRRPKDLITWLMIPFFLVHCMIGHKEMRFIYPLSIFVPIIFVHWLSVIPKPKIVLKWVIALNFILLPVASLKPAFSAIGLYHFLWDNEISKVQVVGDFPKPLWLYMRNQSLKFNQVNSDQLSEGWVFSNKFHFLKEIEQNQNCRHEYLSYPRWLIDLMPEKNRNRSKIFSLFYCQ